MTPFASDTYFLDIEYLGAKRRIATGVIEIGDGVLLIDPGPTSALHTVVDKLNAAGFSLDDVRALLLTHIHLDHAGATGSIVERQPDIEVYVHRSGAHHMVDPERLLRSAKRIYGEAMDRLWGAFLPVPETQVTILDGEETLTFGKHRFEVAYTPGHAKHHVSYLDTATGTAFVGDTAGMRVTGINYVLPVAPPPDVDLEAWSASLNILRDWSPERLFVTHFGPSEEVVWHLDEMERLLALCAEKVRVSLEHDAEDDELASRFKADMVRYIQPDLSAEDLGPYEQFGQLEPSWYGFARYWRKRLEAV